MDKPGNDRFIKTLQNAVRRERASQRLYEALATHEKNPSRKNVLLKLAESERIHGQQWVDRLSQLGAAVPPNTETPGERLWRWALVQSGTDNALKRIESAENDDTEFYDDLAKMAPSEADRAAFHAAQHDEEGHSRVTRKGSEPVPAALDPQGALDRMMKMEHWHKRGGGWIGDAIYGANDGLGSVFGIVSGVAGATAGGPAVLIAGLAGMLASALSMGSGAYLATKAEREIHQAEVARERQELIHKPEEEREELSLFYQLKGVPQDEADQVAAHLIAQPEQALKTLASEELGISEQTFPNPWRSAISATLSTAFGAFIPIIPFFFTHGLPAIIISFAISTAAHFLIGAAKTVVTGLSPWKSGLEMTAVGLGEAIITYVIGLLLSPVVG